MKVAEVIATFPPTHGGMGYVCYNNAEQLAKLGHDVTVFTLDHGSVRYDDPPEFKIDRLRTPLLLGDGGVIPHLFARIRNFDVVHLHFPFYGGAEYVYLASRLRKQKFLMTYHMDVYGATTAKRLVISVYERMLMRRIVDEAACIAALSREHLQSSKVAGLVDWQKVVELPNGVDAVRFAPREKDQPLIQKYGLAGKTVVLFVGNLQPFKGLHLLIDAVSGVEDKNVVLLIVGSGYGEQRYRQQVKDRGIGKRVIFAGPQFPQKELPAHYNLGDFLVLPSTHSESFGLVVLEAMASGIPAVVSSLPGPSRLVDDGKDGLIVQAGDSDDLKRKIEYLAREQEKRRAMGSAGREKVLQKYVWKEIGLQLEGILQKIVKSA